MIRGVVSPGVVAPRGRSQGQGYPLPGRSVDDVGVGRWRQIGDRPSSMRGHVMVENYSVSCGVAVGKGEHHAVGLNPEGT